MKLAKAYEPNQYESDIYALWEASGAFKPREHGAKGAYSIVMPPPNANAGLHLGHVLTGAIEDIAARYHRLRGKSVALLPGADHAGFETWVVYEKKLNKEGKTRFDYSREDLYKQVWDFVQLNKANFEEQWRKIGVSCDWSRFTFTLDEKVVNQAYATFKKMWEEKLIYRGERLVNFCTHHGTSFSDIEVVYKEVSGHLWHIKYPLTDGSGHVVVATTRPETMLGDTAVAVHPTDDRYAQFIGKTVRLPLTQRDIPIIADEMVDTAFGTGAVKITPAHDPNDFDVAERHDLPMITVIAHDGTMTHDVPEPYQGLSVDEARKIIVNDLRDIDALEKTEDYQHSVGHCYKCGTVIQPLLREQWFVDMKPLASAAIKHLRAGEIEFLPTSKLDQSINYLKNIRDWNISRQIAWGIPIPAFQNIDDPEDWIYDERVTEELITVDGKTYRRDPDVFDTWFSSGQWPYVTLGLDTEDFKKFYPLSLMETGGEILYQWVCRMIMLGVYVTGKVPFKKVYIHGYVMAEDGAKMSKSLGNVIDPMPVIEQFGSDAVRMGIVAGRMPAVNRGYDQRRIEEARNFTNKLWNVARYIEDKLGDDYQDAGSPKPETAADDWLLYQLQHSIRHMTEHMEAYRFAEAYELLYHLIWDDVADWYVEASKSALNKPVLAYTLETILRLAHPFAPFATETIWQTLSWKNGSLLITDSWPEPPHADSKKAAEFEEVKTIVSEIRYIVGVLHLRSGISLYHTGDTLLAEQGKLIKSLARLENIQEVRDGHGLHLTSTTRRCWLDLDQESIRTFLSQLQLKKDEQAQKITQLESRLSNANYVKNAPKAIVEETRQQLAETQATLERLKNEYSRFSQSVE